MNLLKEDITGSIGTDLYLCSIQWRAGTFMMDEPTDINGKDRGPDPYTTLLAALAGCTLSTLRMYIDRKGWNIPTIKVRLNMEQSNVSGAITTTIERHIDFGAVDAETRDRLLVIAGKCPVSKILENKILIPTDANYGNLA